MGDSQKPNQMIDVSCFCAQCSIMQGISRGKFYKYVIHKNGIKWSFYKYVIHKNGIKWSMFPVSLEIILHEGFLGFMFHLMMALAILSKIYKIGRIINTIKCHSQWYALLWFEVLNFLRNVSFVTKSRVHKSCRIICLCLFVFVFSLCSNEGMWVTHWVDDVCFI